MLLRNLVLAVLISGEVQASEVGLCRIKYVGTCIIYRVSGYVLGELKGAALIVIV